MQVELIKNGGYSGTSACVGKVFDAKVVIHGTTKGYSITIDQLVLAGYEDDGSVTDWLFFLYHEVRVLDDK